jgi:hypothetical protein
MLRRTVITLAAAATLGVAALASSPASARWGGWGWHGGFHHTASSFTILSWWDVHSSSAVTSLPVRSSSTATHTAAGAFAASPPFGVGAAPRVGVRLNLR